MGQGILRLRDGLPRELRNGDPLPHAGLPLGALEDRPVPGLDQRDRHDQQEHPGDQQDRDHEPPAVDPTSHRRERRGLLRTPSDGLELRRLLGGIDRRKGKGGFAEHGSESGGGRGALGRVLGQRGHGRGGDVRWNALGHLVQGLRVVANVRQRHRDR